MSQYFSLWLLYFSGPGPNPGSDLAFSCHVSLYHYILRFKYLSMKSRLGNLPGFVAGLNYL